MKFFPDGAARSLHGNPIGDGHDISGERVGIGTGWQVVLVDGELEAVSQVDDAHLTPGGEGLASLAPRFARHQGAVDAKTARRPIWSRTGLDSAGQKCRCHLSRCRPLKSPNDIGCRPLGVPRQYSAKQLVLTSEGPVHAWAGDAHLRSEIVEACAVITVRPEDEHRLLEGLVDIESSRPAGRPLIAHPTTVPGRSAHCSVIGFLPYQMVRNMRGGTVAKVVLITGGTSGIGLSLAECFLTEGYSVVVCARSQAMLDEFGQTHPESLAVRADVTDRHARAAMLDAIEERFGRLDVLVNNAGTFIERDFTAGENSTETLDEEVDLNLTAPIHLTGEVLRRWAPLEAIVFVTSGFALVSPKRAPTYGAVKAGLHGFADGLRRQLAPIGTHVLEVLPPLTDTPMNADVVGRPKLSPDEVAAITLKALRRRQPTASPGGTRMLRPLLRIAPRTLDRKVGNL